MKETVVLETATTEQSLVRMECLSSRERSDVWTKEEDEYEYSNGDRVAEA